MPITAPVRVSPSVAAAGPGDPEVGDLHLARGGDEDVARLHVAVHDAVLVRERERRGDVGTDVGDLRRREQAVGPDHVAQGATVDVLHHDEGGAVLLAPVEDADDVGLVQAGRRLGLTPEPLDEHRVARELGREDLERDGAVELRVAGEVHVGHAAVRDLADDLVAVGEDGRGRVHEPRQRYPSAVRVPGMTDQTRSQSVRYLPSRNRRTFAAIGAATRPPVASSRIDRRRARR